ncbi:MAG: sodium:solute symporter family protein [Candidatus Paceibacterota bacterium]
MGDYFAYRYSEKTRRLASSIIVLVSFIWVAIQFIAFASLIGVVTNINFPLALFITAFLTILYTSFSGIKGDFYTDAIQFFVMLPVFILVFIKGFALIEPGTFLNVPADLLNPYNYDGPVFFYAGIILGFPLIITAMEAWQRIFAAFDMKTAQRAFYLSGVLKVIVIGAAMTLGFLAIHILPSGVENDSALFALMTELLPSGLLGLGLASILAILMSTVDSLLMVGSATVTKDFYLLKNPEANDKKKLLVGRIAILVIGMVGLGVAFLVPDIIQLSIVSAQIAIIFAPALIGGLIWDRPDHKAGFWSILIGLVSTVIVLPFSVNLAFVPGVVLALIVYISLSLRSKTRFDLIK